MGDAARAGGGVVLGKSEVGQLVHTSEENLCISTTYRTARSRGCVRVTERLKSVLWSREWVWGGLTGRERGARLVKKGNCKGGIGALWERLVGLSQPVCLFSGYNKL